TVSSGPAPLDSTRSRSACSSLTPGAVEKGTAWRVNWSRIASRWLGVAIMPPVPGAVRRRSRDRGPDIARPGRAPQERRRDLAPGVPVRPADRLHVRAEDRPAVLPAPFVRVDDGRQRSLEARHHVAREQLVAPERLLAAGPLVGAEQEPAEAALAQLHQPLDPLAHGVGGPDQRGPLTDAFAQRIVVT